jgi:hypothetical protein
MVLLHKEILDGHGADGFVCFSAQVAYGSYIKFAVDVLQFSNPGVVEIGGAVGVPGVTGNVGVGVNPPGAVGVPSELLEAIDGNRERVGVSQPAITASRTIMRYFIQSPLS